MPDKDFFARLEVLQKTFAASLPDKISRLEKMLGQCTSSFAACRTIPGEALREAHLVAHSLAGSAGTFGFKSLGEEAHALEEVLMPLLHDEAPADAAFIEHFRQGVATVRNSSLLAAAPPARFAVTVPAQAKAKQDERSLCLVEGDATLAASLAKQLSHFGYQVRIFTHPGEVVPAVQSALPVAIIMVDAGFPDEVLTAFRSALRESFHAVPLLFISARGDFSSRLAAVRAGGSAYFTKPVDISELVGALDALPSQSLPTVYRILIVEDSESTAAFYQQVLSAAGMEVMAIHDPSRITEPLVEFAPDLILMDIYMPVCSGIELAALIRQQPSFIGIPIVFLSTETNTNRHLVALREGGDDFLSKPIDPARLVSVTISRARRGRALRARMTTDGLTGLLNHSHLEQQLETEIVRSQRQGKPLVFAMLDLDHFKHVNDRWGHTAGDHVLQSLAKLLRQRLRRTDVAGRYGGEEFGLILTDIDTQTALPLLDAIRHDFSALRHASGDTEFSVSFSAGMAEFPRQGKAGALIDAADAALYAAKQAGRNRIAQDGNH